MSWSDLVGHEAVIRLLKGELKGGRLPHAILLVGPDGVGKRTLALELAKTLECESPKRQESCEACEPCRKIQEDAFADFKRLVPESKSRQIRIDQVRALGSWIALSPYGGRWKTGIIEEAHRLTEEATHACLRLLEELPDKNTLILTAVALYRLPQTVVSRCHVVRCLPQGIERVEEALKKREKLSAAGARMLAVSSGGRFGLALRLHQTGAVEKKNAVLDQLLNAIQRGELEVPLGNAPRTEILEALEWWASWWRDLLILSVGGDRAWVIHQDRLKELERYSASNRVDLFLDQLERTFRVQEALQRNASARLALGVLLSNGGQAGFQKRGEAGFQKRDVVPFQKRGAHPSGSKTVGSF